MITNLTYEKASTIWDYDPDTGVIRWKIKWFNQEIGNVAGCVNTKGYRNLKYKYITYKAHRIAWLLTYKHWPKNQLDHNNRIRDDNRLCNLQEVNNSINQRNQKLPSNNTSKVMGVSWHKGQNKWAAYIYDTHKIYLGADTDWFEAVCARKSAEARYGFHPNHGRIQ